MKVVGLDPSYSKSGLSDGKTTELVITKPSDDTSALADSIRRAREIAVATRLFMLRAKAPKLYCEAPMIGPDANHLYEVGILMSVLADEIGTDNIVLVTPSTLKKHLTGHGDAPSKHAQCEAPRKNGKGNRPKCVVCGALELHNISFDKDAGRDRLHGWGLWHLGTEVEAGRIQFSEPARRGKGKTKVAHANAVANRKERAKRKSSKASVSVRKPRAKVH